MAHPDMLGRMNGEAETSLDLGESTEAVKMQEEMEMAFQSSRASRYANDARRGEVIWR